MDKLTRFRTIVPRVAYEVESGTRIVTGLAKLPYTTASEMNGEAWLRLREKLSSSSTRQTFTPTLGAKVMLEFPDPVNVADVATAPDARPTLKWVSKLYFRSLRLSDSVEALAVPSAF